MKQIIALEGHEKSGKSSTINLLISKVLMELSVSNVEKHHVWRDKTFVFYINDKTVMITTIGDDNAYLERQLVNVSKLHEDNCDIIVYAKREGRDFECINKLVDEKGYKQSIIKKIQGQIKTAYGNTITYSAMLLI
jgi:hypothetical protein